MELYFSPLACSLATRIALYEAGASASYVEVDTKTATLLDGADYRAIHPLAMVPVLRLDSGETLTENAAILQYVAEAHPDAGLSPRDAMGKTRLRQWLCFIGTELHKLVFAPLLDETAPAEVKSYALAKAPLRFGWLSAALEGRDWLLDDFSVADAYLFAVLNWTAVTPIDLSRWPAISAFHARAMARPSVAKAFAEERALYVKELGRRAAHA